MQLTLRLKMFLILVATSATLILSMLFFTLSSFEVGFGEYLDEVNEQRMGKLSQRLGVLHQQYGSFGFLEQDPVLAAALEELLWEGESEAELLDDLPEEEIVELEQYYTPLFFIISLEKTPLYGDYDPDLPARLKPVYEADQQIAWLGIHEQVFGDGSVTFIEAQTREFWIIALIMVLISAAAALISANHFQRAIRPLVKGTRALTEGEYTTRIPVQGKDELADLSRDFNRLASTLEQNEIARRRWVEDISHELKTPLTLMSGEIEAVRDGIREVTPATLELLSQDVARLNHLVDDLKALWQSEPGAIQLNREPCQLHQLLGQSLDKFRGQLLEQQISLDLDIADNSPLQADPHRMAQVFDNILSNTLRYTDQPGCLSVSLRPEADQYRLVLSDSGPGVPDADLPRLFDRLYRVERSRNRAHGGVGIGLAICRNIVLAHGGTISASRSDQGGLSLTITLPGRAST